MNECNDAQKPQNNEQQLPRETHHGQMRSVLRTGVLAGSVGFATALILMAGIQTRSGDGEVPQNALPPASMAVDTVETSVMADSGENSSPGLAPGLQRETVSEGQTVSVLADVPPAPDSPDCRNLAEELWRREEAGEFTYDEYVELSEEEYNNAPLNLPFPRTDVANGERPVFASFEGSLDILLIPNDRLDEVVGRCWELGLID